jgi:hypothetical protein
MTNSSALDVPTANTTPVAVRACVGCHAIAPRDSMSWCPNCDNYICDNTTTCDCPCPALSEDELNELIN